MVFEMRRSINLTNLLILAFKIHKKLKKIHDYYFEEDLLLKCLLAEHAKPTTFLKV